jgi:hypothetical protein
VDFLDDTFDLGRWNTLVNATLFSWCRCKHVLPDTIGGSVAWVTEEIVGHGAVLTMATPLPSMVPGVGPPVEPVASAGPVEPVATGGPPPPPPLPPPPPDVWPEPFVVETASVARAPTYGPVRRGPSGKQQHPWARPSGRPAPLSAEQNVM